jgi:ribosomal protein S30
MYRSVHVSVSKSFSVFRLAGAVRSRTPLVPKDPNKKRKKNGRAKQRSQYNKKVLRGGHTAIKIAPISNYTVVPRKTPPSICGAESASSLKKLAQLIDPSHGEVAARKSYEGRIGLDDSRSHTQKNKGVNGKSIQREKRNASSNRINSIMHGES